MNVQNCKYIIPSVIYPVRKCENYENLKNEHNFDANFFFPWYFNYLF